MEGQAIVFAYWKDGTFMGFRADTFNTISKDYPKIYTYSKEQVDTVLGNVKSGCNRVGQSLSKLLTGKQVVGVDGSSIDGNDMLDHLTRTENMLRDWNEFEVRVHPFPKDEFRELGEGDEWKKEKILSELEPALEVHKFKIIKHEN